MRLLGRAVRRSPGAAVALALVAQLRGRDALAQDASPPVPPAEARAEAPRPQPAPLLPTRKAPATRRDLAAPRPRDPLATEGAAILVGSGIGAVIGIVVLATATEPETCGLTGCFERPDNGQRKLGTALIAGSVGAGLIGAPALLAGLVGQAPTDADRRSEPMMLTGAALTASGNAIVGLGVGLLIADPGDGADIPAAALFAAGSSVIAIGVPFWARGASRAKRGWKLVPASAPEERPEVVVGARAVALRWRF